jgi:hypothetical protein
MEIPQQKDRMEEIMCIVILHLNLILFVSERKIYGMKEANGKRYIYYIGFE